MMPNDPLSQLQCSENKSWCPIPWMSCSTSTNGHYRLCVQANTHRETRGLFYNAEGDPLTAREHSLRETRNAPLAKQVRQFMLQGKDHPVCTRCKNEESNGIVSRRAHARNEYATIKGRIDFDECARKTEGDGEIEHSDFPVLELDLRMGNRCNLKCRSCYPGESSAWYKEWFDTVSKRFTASHLKIELSEKANKQIVAANSNLDWPECSKLFEELPKDAPAFERVHLVGGEPMLIEEHFKALEAFVESGRSKEITLDYNSNITLIPARAFKLWESFKKVKIGYSIDGVGGVNEYIRFPSQWESIEKTLHKLDQSNIDFDLWPTVTVMAYNVFYIPEIIGWQIQSQFKKQNIDPSCLFMVAHPLRNPDYLSVQILPRPVKQAVRAKYREFQKGWFEDHIKTHLAPDTQTQWRERLDFLLTGILNFMDAEDHTAKLPLFLEKTETMDRYREQDFWTALPELAGLLKKEGL